MTSLRPTLIVEVEPPPAPDDSGEVPLPPWALLLGGGLLAGWRVRTAGGPTRR